MDQSVPRWISRNDPAARLLSLYDTPAYVRRGVRLESGLQGLFARCAEVREQQLHWVRVHLEWLRKAVHHWNDLAELMDSSGDWQALIGMAGELLPATDPAAFQTASRRRLRSLLRGLMVSIDRFNSRWSRFIGQIDLNEINLQVAAYNRYYLLEKECAMGSPRLARRGFQPASEVTHAELLGRFPLLPVIQLRRCSRGSRD